ncbi:MAG: ATP-binding protein [Pirellulales bacterium]|nr:ATP-binding protein [Pirellulales bacterium]
MQDYEKLGVFYLGRQYDLAAQKAQEDLLLYDSKDLTTHAVCVGMTGSGKTGLCLGLLEEAAIDGIPAIAIDPKGDLGNLLLTFPDLKPEDFRPWIDPSAAVRKGLTADDYARRVADDHRQGLAEWGQEPDRIARFRDAVDMAIYTPGNSAGLPLTVLRSLSPPPAAVVNDSDLFRARIAAVASGLLALVGIQGDPLRSREHILLATILDRAWREGQELDLARLIREIQSPPFDKIGVIDLETSFPAKERFELAMSLNNLMASPGFSAWLEGEPLDVQRLLYTSVGKPRLSILSLAHLGDAERMFFVTILLNEVIAWMRVQSGTSSLRALLYMDEVFGYFPPTANPPSKTPMLTLLKQARAFGLGVVLATQNPVDLDYKGLANAGTWFLGRLQTERDKARVLDGLQSATVSSGAGFDRQKIETILSSLGNRVFLMNNVHEDQPIVFQTRWVLSYLRGPLTRDQIAGLMQARKQSAPPRAAGIAAVPGDVAGASPAAATGGSRPVLPPGISEAFLVSRERRPAGAGAVYRPALLGIAQVHFTQASQGVDTWRDATLLALAENLGPGEAVWERAQPLAEAPEVETEPPEGALFAELPGELARPKTYASLAADLKSHLYRTQALTLLRSPLLKETSRPDESEGDFRIRIRQAVVEQRDLAVERLRAKYAPKAASLQEQRRKAEQRVVKERAQANESTFSAAVTIGSSMLGALLGRKMLSATTMSKAATSARAAGRVARQRADVGTAEETVATIDQRLADLDAQFKSEAEKIQRELDPDAVTLEPVEVKPKKADVSVKEVSLVWTA